MKLYEKYLNEYKRNTPFKSLYDRLDEIEAVYLSGESVFKLLSNLKSDIIKLMKNTKG